MIWTGYCNLMDNLKVLSTLEVNKTVNGLWRTVKMIGYLNQK